MAVGTISFTLHYCADQKFTPACFLPVYGLIYNYTSHLPAMSTITRVYAIPMMSTTSASLHDACHKCYQIWSISSYLGIGLLLNGHCAVK